MSENNTATPSETTTPSTTPSNPPAVTPEKSSAPGVLDASITVPKKGDAAGGATPPAVESDSAKPNAESDKKPDEGAGEAAKKDDVVTPPEKYDLALPEKTLLQSENLAEVESFAKAHGLSKVQAQAMLERESDYAQARIDEVKRLSTQVWPEEMKKDPDIAGKDGSELNRNIELAKHAVAKFDTDKSLSKVLDESGLGNHPQFVKFMSRVGRAISEDVAVQAGNSSGSEKSLAEIMYPNTVFK